MTLSQFSCPHCASPFQIDTSVPSQQVACPHCGQAVAIANEPPIETTTLDEPPIAEPPPVDPPAIESSPPPLPTEATRTYSQSDLLPPTRLSSQSDVAVEKPPKEDEPVDVATAAPPPTGELVADDFLTRQNTYDERSSRKFIKNTIIWTICAIVLMVVLAYFVRPSGG